MVAPAALPAAGLLYWVGALGALYAAALASYRLLTGLRIWVLGSGAAAVRPALGAWAEEVKYRERWRLPSFLRCISWNRRSWRKDHEAKAANKVHEDDLQDPEEEVALTSLSPNGNCKDAGGTGT